MSVIKALLQKNLIFLKRNLPNLLIQLIFHIILIVLVYTFSYSYYYDEPNERKIFKQITITNETNQYILII